MVLGLVLLVVVGSLGGLAVLLLVPPRSTNPEAPDDQPRFIESLPPVPPARPRGTELTAARPIVVPLPPPPSRTVRRCGHCRAQGHSRALCPRLTGAMTLPRL